MTEPQFLLEALTVYLVICGGLAAVLVLAIGGILAYLALRSWRIRRQTLALAERLRRSW